MRAWMGVVVVLLVLAPSARAAAPIVLPPRVAPGPVESIGVDAPVNALAQIGGKVYLGGAFHRAGPLSGSAVLLDGATGAAAGRTARVEGQVFTAIGDGAGGAYLAGAFGAVGGLRRLNVAHLLADGSVDPAFVCDTDQQAQGLVLAGGRLWVGGDFSVAGGLPRRRLAAVDPVTGSPDGTIDVPVDGKVTDLATDGQRLFVGGVFKGVAGRSRNGLAALKADTGELDPGFDLAFDGKVETLAVRDGRLYVGGQFDNIGGRTRANLAALKTDTGDVDTGFAPSVDGRVVTVVPTADRLYIGGEFAQAAGETRRSVASLDPVSGVADKGFAVTADKDVYAIGVSADRVFLAGNFTTLDGQPRAHLAAVDPGTGALTAWNPDPDDDVYTLAVLGDRVLVGGKFVSVPRTVRNGLAAVDAATGQLDPGFAPSVAGTVDKLLVRDGRLYVAGSFLTVDGHKPSWLAALDPTTGAAVPGFRPLLNGEAGLLVGDGDRLLVAGSFTKVGGHRVGALPFVALDADTGLRDPAFSLSAPGREPLVTGSPTAVLVDGDRLLVAGLYVTRLINHKHDKPQEHVPPRVVRRELASGLLAFGRGDGRLQLGFQPRVRGTVLTLLTDGERLLVGGELTRRVGFRVVRPKQGKPYRVPVVRQNLVAVGRRTGARVLAFRPNPTGTVRALLRDADRLYAAGDFELANRVRTCGLAAMAPSSGAVDASYAPQPNGPVTALLRSGDRLYAGGAFTGFGFGLQVEFGALPLQATDPPPGTPTDSGASGRTPCA